MCVKNMQNRQKAEGFTKFQASVKVYYNITKSRAGSTSFMQGMFGCHICMTTSASRERVSVIFEFEFRSSWMRFHLKILHLCSLNDEACPCAV